MSFGEYEVRLKLVGDPVAYEYDESDVSLTVSRSGREPSEEEWRKMLALAARVCEVNAAGAASAREEGR